jgi:hypothetical protein
MYLIFVLLILGFGSTHLCTVDRDSVHYDCGCIITENGELVLYSSNEHNNQLNVPAIYTVYFSTFGAMVSYNSIN